MFDLIVGFPRMKVGVRIAGERVAEIRYLPPAVAEVASTTILGKEAQKQLERYREDPNTRFDLPVEIHGTPFQRALWEALCEIPRGKTLTYGELARRLGAEPRAVGQGCGANRLPLVIPCHRVVAADGIGGFSHSTEGYLIEAKRWLLAHERAADAFELVP